MSPISVAIASVLVLASISLLSAQAEAENITVTVRTNLQAVFDGARLDDAWFTIDGQRYDNGSYSDMGDWVYPSPPNEDGSINSEALDHTLVLPPKSDEFDMGVKLCLEDSWDYKSCQFVSYREIPETISFLYPESSRLPIIH